MLQLSKVPKCFICNEFSHKSKDCPKKTKAANVNVMAVPKKNNNSVPVVISSHELNGMVDTLSDLTIIREDVWRKVKDVNAEACDVTTPIIGYGGIRSYTRGSDNLKMEIGGDTFDVVCHIAKKKDTDHVLILGQDFLNTVNYAITSNGIKIQKMTEQEANNDESLPDVQGNEKVIIPNDDDVKMMMEIQTDDVILDVPCEYENIITNFISNYRPKKPDTVNVMTKVILSDDVPINMRPRRLAPKEREFVDKQIGEWLQDDIIEESNSDYASALVVVPKRDGSYRVCVDFRQLNKKIQKDRYPMPLIEDQIDKLTGAKIFTTLDLKNSYFHVPVAEESRKYLSFVTHRGQYQFKKTPFGLCLSAASFGRLISTVFKCLINDGTVLTFVDDLIIPAENYDEAIVKLTRVLKVAEDNGLNFNWKKCSFLQKTVDYLGFTIHDGTVSPSGRNLDAVKRFPAPTTVKQVQRLVVMTGYFRKFIPMYCIIAKPLTGLTKKDVKFKFKDDEMNAMRRLIECLTTKPVLQIYNPDADIEVHTDASIDGYGGVLLQRGEDGIFHPVYYTSAKTSAAERNYSPYHLEVLAVVHAIKKFRVYLLGKPFKLVTDCSAFTHTLTGKELSPRVARWVLMLEEYEYTVEHRPGRLIPHADALSRAPVVMQIESETIKKVKAAQNHDERIKTILAIIENQPYEDYVVQNGILYKESNGKKLLVIPDGMQNEIIKMCHEIGHFGVKKTEELINKDYFIPKAAEKIRMCMDNCVRCILSERKTGKRDGLLRPIPKGDVPLDTLHLDHVGPLPSTNKNFNHLLTMIDAFTKFVWIFPVKSTGADEVVRKLLVHFDVFGSPRRMIVDRGSAFTSNTFLDFCKWYDIEVHHVTTGVPRGNGQIERVHRTLIPVLTKLSIDEPMKWYRHVGTVQRYLNCTHQRAINTTPFELMVGVPMKNPEMIEIAKIIEEEMRQEFDEQREALRRSAVDAIDKIQNENKKNYNKRSKEAPKYKSGDWVSILKTQFGSGMKLRPKFMGPYRIDKVLGADRYEMTRMGGNEGPQKTSSSADHMKPWPVGQNNVVNRGDHSRANDVAGGPNVGIQFGEESADESGEV